MEGVARISHVFDKPPHLASRLQFVLEELALDSVIFPLQGLQLQEGVGEKETESVEGFLQLVGGDLVVVVGVFLTGKGVGVAAMFGQELFECVCFLVF